jgi:hypothetical protein
MAFCSAVPRTRFQRISNPCRWWNDSSLQTRIIARAYGPYEHRRGAHEEGAWVREAANAYAAKQAHRATAAGSAA